MTHASILKEKIYLNTLLQTEPNLPVEHQDPLSFHWKLESIEFIMIIEQYNNVNIIILYKDFYKQYKFS